VTGYVRPDVPERAFHDAHGRRIDYGVRWGGGSPPEDTYSVTAHPERFAPLHAVAEALVAHLAATYRVEVSDDSSHAGGDLPLSKMEVVRVVRLVPDDPGAAAMTVILTSFPSVLVRAGLLHVFRYPICGCDACDEDWASLADELERYVFAVTAGEYREFVLYDPELWVGYSIRPGGHGRESSRATASSEEIARIEALARELPERWAPWPRRTP
jgi:Family of unknown function (DUF6226)